MGSFGDEFPLFFAEDVVEHFQTDSKNREMHYSFFMGMSGFFFSRQLSNLFSILLMNFSFSYWSGSAILVSFFSKSTPFSLMRMKLSVLVLWSLLAWAKDRYF